MRYFVTDGDIIMVSYFIEIYFKAYTFDHNFFKDWSIKSPLSEKSLAVSLNHQGI